MIPVEKLRSREETYTFVTLDDEVIHLAVGRLNAFLEGTDHPMVAVTLTDELYNAVIEKSAVDRDHLAAMPDEVLLRPVTLIEMLDETYIPVDGTHRIVKAREQYQIPAIPGWLVPLRLWKRFQLSGIPGSAVLWNELNRDPKRYTLPEDIVER